MTKAEEKKILSQIETLIASAGADSYIGIAFRGCVEDAKTNIENDWGCSRADAAEAAEKKLAEAVRDADGMKAELESARAELEALKDEAEKMKAALAANVKIARAAWNESKTKFQSLTETATDAEITAAFRDMKAKESAVKAACECL